MVANRGHGGTRLSRATIAHTFLKTSRYTSLRLTGKEVRFHMISTKWWVSVAATVAMSTAAMAVPGVSSAHSLPASAVNHHQPKQAASRKARLMTVTGRLATTRHGMSLVTSTGKTFWLRLGPPWYLAQSLAKQQGQSATVEGRLSGHILHVTTVNGQPVRNGSGKPPWAGHGGKGHGKG